MSFIFRFLYPEVVSFACFTSFSGSIYKASVCVCGVIWRCVNPTKNISSHMHIIFPRTSVRECFVCDNHFFTVFPVSLWWVLSNRYNVCAALMHGYNFSQFAYMYIFAVDLYTLLLLFMRICTIYLDVIRTYLRRVLWMCEKRKHLPINNKTKIDPVEESMRITFENEKYVGWSGEELRSFKGVDVLRYVLSNFWICLLNTNAVNASFDRSMTQHKHYERRRIIDESRF